MKRKIKKFLWTHPYFLDSSFAMSMVEARTIVKNFNFPDFLDMIQEAKRKSDPLKADWRIFDKFYQKKQKVLWSFHPRTAVFFILLLGFLLSFSVFPKGKAFAKEIFSLMIRAVENVIYIENKNQENVRIVEDTESHGSNSLYSTEFYGSVGMEESFFSTLNDFVTVVGKIPVVIKDSVEKITLIQYINSDINSDILITLYSFENGTYITLMQEWGEIPTSQTSVKSGISFEREIMNGIKMYCLHDQEDQSKYGKAILNDSVLSFGTVEGVDFDSYINQLEYYEFSKEPR